MNNAQHDNKKHELTQPQVAPQSEPDLDAALEALQAVVLAQKAQIDALLASLEGLLAALNAPHSSLSPLSSLVQISASQLRHSSEFTAQAGSQMGSGNPLPVPTEQTCADSALLGNPQDPQFVSLHQLMGRLRGA